MNEKYKHAYEIIENWERVEEAVGSRWRSPEHLTPDEEYLMDLNNPRYFRLKPAKRMVALTAEDIRPGMVFQVVGISGTSWRPPQCVETGGVLIFDAWQNWESLRRNFEYSLDGITWLKCEREVVS